MTGEGRLELGRYPTTRMRRNRADDWNRRLVAENKLGEFTYASPAIAHDRFYIRGEKHLFCLGTETAAGK